MIPCHHSTFAITFSSRAPFTFRLEKVILLLKTADMSQTKFNPSQQVERIREILVGREMNRIDRRLSHLEHRETPRPQSTAPSVSTQLARTQQSLLRETQQLKQSLQQEAVVRQQQITQLARKISQSPQNSSQARDLETQVRDRITTLSHEMTALIDARSREILHHLQREILQWKSQMDRELESIREVKADRKDVRSRFARLAAAAMEDEPENETRDGFLL
jgi:type I site-specific restriction endonuclease